MIIFTAVFLFSSCEKKDDSVIDPSISAPLISNPLLSKDTVFTTSSSPVINFITAVSVSLNDGSPLSSMICTVKDPAGNTVGQFSMNDNGSSPDSTAGDGRYTAVVNLSSISCLIVGKYSVEYLAANTSGLYSNLLTSGFFVVNTANQPPVVSALHAPSVIQVPASGVNTGVLSVFTNDPDGHCDIRNVFFNSYRPDGTITGGSPFTMYDDGNIPLHGDTVAGDGRYSLIISIPSTQTTFGYFKFIYQAKDNSNFISNELIDSINVVH